MKVYVKRTSIQETLYKNAFPEINEIKYKSAKELKGWEYMTWIIRSEFTSQGLVSWLLRKGVISLNKQNGMLRMWYNEVKQARKKVPQFTELHHSYIFVNTKRTVSPVPLTSIDSY